MTPVDRRRVLKMAGSSIVGASLAGCSGTQNGDGDGGSDGGGGETTARTTAGTATEEMVKMKTLEPEGAITVPVFLYGIQNGAWEEQNIDLSLEVAAFGKFVRQIDSELSHIGGVSVPSQISFVNQGTDLTMVGQQLNLYNRIYTTADADIESIEDLSDKVLGVPPEGTTTTNAVKSMIQAENGFDIMNDTKNTRSSAPPTLLGFLDRGEVDAVLLFSGDTVSAAASDEYKTLYDPYAVWKDKTGYAPPVANYTVKTSWLESNPDLARRFLKGWASAVELFSQNTSDAITNFGRLGGLTTEGESEVAKQWQSEGLLFGPTDYTQELADSNWQLIEAMSQYGTTFSELPDKDAFITTASELAEL